jgi:hypothetical protein
MQEFIALCSELIAFGNPFQTVAMAARRVSDKFFGGSISRLNGCGWGRVKNRMQITNGMQRCVARHRKAANLTAHPKRKCRQTGKPTGKP